MNLLAATDIPFLLMACALTGVSAGCVALLAVRAMLGAAGRNGRAIAAADRLRPVDDAHVGPLRRLARAAGSRVRQGRLRRRLIVRYQQAGYPGDWSEDAVVGAAVLLGVGIAAMLMLGLGLLRWPLAPLGLLALPAGMGLALAHLGDLARKRRLEIARSMPFVMDLMAMSLQAGAPMQMTMERVAEDHEGQPVGEEFARVLADVRSGMTFADAVAALRDRVPIREIEVFADDVIQSERMGRPIAETLERSSRRFKVFRVQSAQAAAGRAKVLVLLPGTLVLLAGLIILFAPFALKFMQGGYGF